MVLLPLALLLLSVFVAARVLHLAVDPSARQIAPAPRRRSGHHRAASSVR